MPGNDIDSGPQVLGRFKALNASDAFERTALVMNMRTLDSYNEGIRESRIWKRILGGALSFVGSALFTHAFLVFVPFGRALPLWAELAFSLTGGVIGAIGLSLLGYRGDDLRRPILVVVSGVIATLFVYVISNRFGIWGLIVVLALFYLYEAHISWRVEGPS
jgi:hypothetical protein